jgi:hypothetical protein
MKSVIRNELYFSVPEEYVVSEINLNEALSGISAEYRSELAMRVAAKGLDLAQIATMNR